MSLPFNNRIAKRFDGILKPFFSLRIYLGLFAAIITVTSYALANISPTWTYIGSVFFTFSGIYTFNRFTDEKEDRINCPDDHAFLTSNKMSIFIFGVLLALLFGLVLAWIAGPLHFGIIFGSILLGLLYSKNTLHFVKRFKDNSFLKNLIPALVWSVSTCLAISLFSEIKNTLPIFIFAFYIFIIEVEIETAWDFRDSIGDKAIGLKTFGGTSSKNTLYSISAIISLVFCSFGLFLYLSTTFHPLYLGIFFHRLGASIIFYLYYLKPLRSLNSFAHLLVLYHLAALLILLNYLIIL